MFMEFSILFYVYLLVHMEHFVCACAHDNFFQDFYFTPLHPFKEILKNFIQLEKQKECDHLLPKAADVSHQKLSLTWQYGWKAGICLFDWRTPFPCQNSKGSSSSDIAHVHKQCTRPLQVVEALCCMINCSNCCYKCPSKLFFRFSLHEARSVPDYFHKTLQS